MLSAIFRTSFIPTNTLIPIVSLGSFAKQCAAEKYIGKLFNVIKGVEIKVQYNQTNKPGLLQDSLFKSNLLDMIHSTAKRLNKIFDYIFVTFIADQSLC